MLEIGCGRGVAANLIGAHLTTGSVTAIDRSEAAIAAASLINEQAAAEGRVTILKLSFEELALVRGQFDRVVAVNVNRFWQAAADDRSVWRSILRVGARMVLVFETPPGTSAVRERVGGTRYLEANGFSDIRLAQPTPEGRLVGLVATWRGAAGGI
mgnify:FL=1